MSSSDPDFEVPRDEDGVETWDLRTPPTADEVGLEDGELASIHSTTDPRRVRVLLPEGQTIDAELTTVAFDNMLTEGDSDMPTSLILHATNHPLEDSLEDMHRYLDQLDMPDDVVDRWRQDVESSPDRRPKEAGVQASIGYVDVSLGGRYTFESGNASLTWSVGWGEKITGRPVPAVPVE